jgi:hypothetical protein
MKENSFDFNRIRSYDLIRTRPLRYHTADAPDDVLVLIYST